MMVIYTLRNERVNSITLTPEQTESTHTRSSVTTDFPWYLTATPSDTLCLSGWTPDLPICAMSLPLCKQRRQHATWLWRQDTTNFVPMMRGLITASNVTSTPSSLLDGMACGCSGVLIQIQLDVNVVGLDVVGITLKTRHVTWVM